MLSLNRSKIQTRWNKLRGVPIELDLEKYQKTLAGINEHNLGNETDNKLKQMSDQLKTQAREGVSLDNLLFEAFSLVREASRRTIGLRPFDVQVVAGIVMHEGKLAEMQTGEGKPLVAVFPAYLNGLLRKGAHIHTFNDYLARREAAWMGPIYEFLGLNVGCVQEGTPVSERKKAYAADITYMTAKEAGFDYLRDHLCYDREDLVHRPFHFAIVDEADSILIDEARVPLVIAGTVGKTKADPGSLAEVAKSLKPDVDFNTDEGKRNIYLSDSGLKRVEKMLGCGNLHRPQNFDLLTNLNQALHAEFLLNRDIDYIVRKGKIEIVDEFTGRVVLDRHWPDGLQAAVEAKEKLRLGSGGSVLGSITLQHFLQLYPRICGMTATALSAADELHEFYKLKVVIIPPNQPCIRRDYPDVVFTHKEAKKKALIAEIRRFHEEDRPVLVGTASVEESEELSSFLKDSGIACQVLNAKNDELEANIIAQAGFTGAVTISTNMAGRGTDIKLGGADEREREKVVKLGGLYVIGTNRHESLRIDRQLRGRSGRQGDPGSSRFFVSLEDNLIERYGIRNLLPKNIRDMRQDSPVENPLVRSEIARGQRIIEGQNFEIRKTLWNYSYIVEKQRNIVQNQRQEILIEKSTPNLLKREVPKHYAKLSALMGEDFMRKLEKRITISKIDRCWAEHLAMIADVRESIHLTSVGGKPPINEVHKVVSRVFLELEKRINEQIVEKFTLIPVTKERIDLDSEDLRGPSSTWTYLISDSQFGFWMQLLQGSNIGASAWAALQFAPLYFAYGIYKRFFQRKKIDK